MTDLEVVELAELADHWMTQKTGEGLNDVQIAILQQALDGQKLKDIDVTGYTSNTIQREIAPKLWKRLSQVTGKRVSIKTVRFVLEELRNGGNGGQRGQGGQGRQGGQGGRGGFLGSSLLSPSANLDSPLELPGGQLNLASAFYVQRPPIEARACEEIGKPGSLIRIKAPRQMGKTSLMARLLHQAEQQGCRSVVLNFELADNEVFAELNPFLQWFCATVTDDLQLPIQLEGRWSKFLGSKKNCTNYFEKYLLPQINQPLALGLDAVDRIFPYEKVADDFFGLLRAWHEKAKQSDIWKNFRLVIIHGTEVYIPLSLDQSPFNVGLPIELPEFTAEQVHDLAQRHGLHLTPAQIEQLMAMVGGHPHLVRLALYKIARQDITLERLLEEAPTETGIYGDHLRLHLWNLEQHSELAEGLKQVVSNQHPVQLKSTLAFKLNSMGLVHLQGNQVTIRCDLYRQYFCDRLVSSDGTTLNQKGQIPSRISPEPLSGSNSIGENILAAIVFTDVKDSTLKQQHNQKPILAAIHRDLNLMTKLCQQFEGQVLKSVGDGLLMYFVSAVKAVQCTQEIQRALAAAAKQLPKDYVLEHRIGIHLAEVFFNGIDVRGDGVNIASRLQAEAEPGGICISAMVYEAVKTHLHLPVLHSDYRNLKGIEEPVLVYQVGVQE